MRKEMISELCRFYQGEEKCPFEGDALKLWNIERIYFEALRDADKLSLDIAVLFKAEVIDAIGRYYPSEKDELIARYNGSLREIIASVGSGWAEAEKDAQNRLSAIRGKIASMPRKVAESFLSDEIKDHSNFSDSLLGQSYENSGCWVTFDKPSWVLRETIEYHYWRIQDAMDRYFVQDQSDIIKDEVSRFLIHILMRDGLNEIYSEVIEGKKPKSPRVSAVHGEAAPIKTELSPEVSEFLNHKITQIMIEAAIEKGWMVRADKVYRWNDTLPIRYRAYLFAEIYKAINESIEKPIEKIPFSICASVFGGKARSYSNNYSSASEIYKTFTDPKGILRGNKICVIIDNLISQAKYLNKKNLL